MMFRFHFRNAWRSLWRTPVHIVLIAAYGALSAWAIVDGFQWMDRVQEIQSESPADLLTDRQEWFADLQKAQNGEEVSPYSARPMNLTFLALHPPGELSMLAHRGEAMQPRLALISGWRSEASLFRRYEVEGPSSLQLGRIDFVFVVTVVLPLVLLMLTFDVLSAERSAGRVRLFLVQGGSALGLLTARIAAITIPLAGLTVIGVAGASFLARASVTSALLLTLVVLAYAAFWAGVAAMIAVLCRRPVHGALAVLASWAVLVIFIPSASQFLAQAMYPVPSRVAYLSEARAAEGVTRRNLTERAEIYMAEHPGQGNAGDEEVPGFYRASYLANIDINAKTSPMVAAFDQQQQEQRDLANLARFLSPALAAQDLMQQLSGAGPGRAAEFRRQSRDHLNEVLETIGPSTVRGVRLSMAEAESIPEFRFQPSSPPFVAWAGVAWMALLSMLSWMIARREAITLN